MERSSVEQGQVSRINEFMGNHPRIAEFTAGALALGATVGAAKFLNDQVTPASAAPVVERSFEAPELNVENVEEATVSEPGVRVSMPRVEAEAWPKADKAAETSDAHSSSVSRYIKRHSKLKIQPILNKIMYTANSSENDPKWTSRPGRATRATLTPNMAGYGSVSGCREALYTKFIRSPYGITFSTCAAFPPGKYLPGSGNDIQTDKSVPGEYKKPLNNQNTRILHSVGAEWQQPKSLSGNRKKLTAKYKCASANQTSSSGETIGGVEQVVLRYSAKGSKATIKKCP